MSGSPLRLLLRSLAVLIAIAGALDPAVTSFRSARPEVAVIALDSSRDGAQAERVARSLSSSFSVLRAPIGRTAATVLVGDGVPPLTDALGAKVFVVTADRPAATVTLESVDAPLWAPLDGKVLVRAVARAVGAKGKTVEFSLRSGALTVAKMNVSVSADDTRLPVTLAFVPSATGVARLRVGAAVNGSSTVANSDVAVEVGARKFSVLFYDARPSWMTTFVRRAIERDPRFEVTSRVVTSRDISTDVGQPPALFAANAAALPFDAIVVGAPDALRESDVSGLRAFSAQRGGSVVLIADQRGPSILQKVIAPGAWSSGIERKRLPVVPATELDSGRLSATEFAWPARLPASAVTLASSAAAPGDSTGGRPVVWRVAEGAGQFVVSGALDAWRFRDGSVSAFDAFWRLVIADAAAAALPARTLELSTTIPVIGERMSVTIVERNMAIRTRSNESAFAEGTRSALVALDAAAPDAIVDSVRLWPTGQPGVLIGTFRAPQAPGQYRLSTGAGTGAAGLRFTVSNEPALRPTPDSRDLLRAFASAHGGRVIAASDLGTLPALLTAATRAEPRLATWHPMRSGWWIVPFALVLALEWWLRRRRGMP